MSSYPAIDLLKEMNCNNLEQCTMGIGNPAGYVIMILISICILGYVIYVTREVK